MMLTLSTHLAAVLILDLMSLALLAYALRRVVFARRFENFVHKRVLAFLMLGIMLLAFAIISDMLAHIGISSLLVNEKISIVYRTLMPAAFAAAAFFLYRNPEK